MNFEIEDFEITIPSVLLTWIKIIGISISSKVILGDTNFLPLKYLLTTSKFPQLNEETPTKSTPIYIKIWFDDPDSFGGDTVSPSFWAHFFYGCR